MTKYGFYLSGNTHPSLGGSDSCKSVFDTAENFFKRFEHTRLQEYSQIRNSINSK